MRTNKVGNEAREPRPRGRGLYVFGALVAAIVFAGATMLWGWPSGPGRYASGAVDPLLAAKAAYADADYARAEELLRNALLRDGENRGAKLLLGKVLLERGRAHEARELFQAIATADPRNSAAARGLALVYAALGQDDLASMYWRRVTELAPNDATAWRGLSLALHRKGDSMEALAAAQQSLSLDPGQTDLSGLLVQMATAKTPWGDVAPRRQDGRPIDPSALIPKPPTHGAPMPGGVR